MITKRKDDNVYVNNEDNSKQRAYMCSQSTYRNGDEIQISRNQIETRVSQERVTFIRMRRVFCISDLILKLKIVLVR